ncbi:protein kinase domain-containing protein [Endozoicomonas sp.]|uniref:protein kinase domain-containing protein n=1 Tax=Endozoicomonas sp. TaxID=1892382 RepID=UPI0028872CCF|nr:protein kinase [Endozoicomonas sp.]
MLTAIQFLSTSTTDGEKKGALTGLYTGLAFIKIFNPPREVSIACVLTGLLAGQVIGSHLDPREINQSNNTPPWLKPMPSISRADNSTEIVDERKITQAIKDLLKLTPDEEQAPPGTQGQVSKWHDKQGKIFAVKVLKQTEKNRGWDTLYRGEASALDIPKHPKLISPEYLLLRNKADRQFYLIRSLDGVTGNQNQYQVMASVSNWVDGQDLCDLLRTGKVPNAVKFGLDVLGDTLEVLTHMHTNNYVHRDIKIENIMQMQDGYGLIDFGFCRRLEQAEATTPCGTAEFYPPELWSANPSGKYGTDIDLWQLATTSLDVSVGWNPGDYCDGPDNSEEIRSRISLEKDLTREQREKKIKSAITEQNVTNFNSLSGAKRTDYLKDKFHDKFSYCPRFLDLICQLLDSKENRQDIHSINALYTEIKLSLESEGV